MTDQELQALVERISLQSFGKPFRHQAVFNSRLRTTGGRYHLRDHHIDINPRMLTMFGEDTLEGVIKHELVHYHLHMAGQSGQHRTKAFKQLLKAVGGLRFAPEQPRSAKPVKILIYQCEKCGRIYQRKRRINTQKYVCGVCHGKLIYQKTMLQ
ncbi:SprT family protein [Secundilactobacillus folii]|uniref:SprT family protein n=1 Tax=Secundilactobacillus folii TaxID=2678357 RepID=A0A7X2XVG1_9LACO|nr:SprT family protein [Secundilactobacillus folii]MTV82359.1 SprT family protein [Secundilactobacillus folii]